MARITAVTALYDIGREAIDGRTADDYLVWLNATLRLPVPFVIYLDPKIDAAKVKTKPGDTLIQQPKELFKPFSWSRQVESICRHSRAIRTRRDIAFLLPAYGMMVNSKIYALQDAAKRTDADVLLWLDAGISRFFADDLAGCRIDEGFGAKLASAPITFTADPILARALETGKSGHRYVGTCTKLMGGTDIAVSRHHVDRVAEAITCMIEDEWLPRGLWDNDQVVFGSLALRGEEVNIAGVDRRFACLTEELFTYPRRAPKRHSSVIQRLKWHFGEKAPLSA
jgi:hypothetical protein